MAKKPGKPENLITRTPEEARELGKLGGIKSGEVRREKKLMSQIYADILAKKIKLSDGREVDTTVYLEEVVGKLLERNDSATVAIMKEWREATEGSKSTVNATVETVTTEERQRRIDELMAKRNGG